MNRTQVRPNVAILVELRGEVPAQAVDHARAKIAPVISHVREPVLGVRVKLTQRQQRSVIRPALAEAAVDLNGRVVRAQVAGATMAEAIDLLKDRLAGRLARISHRWEAARHRGEPAHRPDRHWRPRQEREIVRRESFAVPPETVDEAAYDMEAMDYDFYLFTDTATGDDCVVYRGGPTGYRVARPTPVPNRTTATQVPVSESPVAAPRHTVEEAVRRLELTGLPFVFFIDPGTGRGSLLYHRHDGHYGLISPTA